MGTKRPANTSLTLYWANHYVRYGCCSLCGNSGMVDTRGVKTPTGREIGREQPCICPNGQRLRETWNEP